MILKIRAYFFMIYLRRIMMKSTPAPILMEGMRIVSVLSQLWLRLILMHSIKRHKMKSIPVLNSLFNSVKKKKEMLVEIEL
jgi:hypothetical protein